MVGNPITSHSPVSVFCVRLVGFTCPPRRAPASTEPPAMGRDKWFSSTSTVKLARGMLQGFLEATLGEPVSGHELLVFVLCR